MTKLQLATLTLGTILAGSGLTLYYAVGEGRLVPAPQTRKDAPFPRTTELQHQRIEVIDAAMENGIIHELDFPKVYVTPKFLILPYEDKQLLIHAIYGWYSDGSNEFLTLYILDYATHEQVARFSTGGGLKLN